MRGMSQRLADYRVFFREFRRSFQSTGAVLPSGPALAAALSRHVREGANERETGRKILEVGPGTGAVTRSILSALGPADRLDLVELNVEFVACLRGRIARDPQYQPVADRIALHHASVEELSEAEPYDVIVSGLPLNNFSVALVSQILAKLQRLLAPGGTLSFFEYVAVRQAKAALSPRAERERLRGIGQLLEGVLSAHEIDRDMVLANVPPAWVHHVRFG
jgi:phosphatidylethanolamine/phosphatidyl-N-methylethanolamine N-methyltransferase